MTVSAEQISKAKAQGLKNVDAAAVVANETGNKFYHLLALLEKESGGKNIYGGDEGPEPGPKDDGTFSGFKDPVSEANYRAFYHEVIVRGRPSNGVGPAQLTYKGFFTDMKSLGKKPWDPYDNITYGAKLWLSYYTNQRKAGYSRDDAIRRAGTKYNSGSYGFIGYGDRLLVIMDKWVGIVGSGDYA